MSDRRHAEHWDVRIPSVQASRRGQWNASVGSVGLKSIDHRRKLGRMDTWIVADPEHLGGSPRVRGTRISVALILESLAAGMSIAEIVDAYPSLTEESVRGVLAELAQRQDLQPA